MTHYTILPMDKVMEGIDAMESATQLLEIVMNGVTMQVQPINQTQATIVRLISCNPQDFFKSAVHPWPVNRI